MPRRAAALLTTGAVLASVAALPFLGGTLSGVKAQVEGQGSTDIVMAEPAPRPATSSTLGLFDEVELAGMNSLLGGEVVETLEVGSGDNLISMLVAAGSSEADATRAISAMSDLFNPRRLQIGQVVTAVLRPPRADTGTDTELAAVSLALGEADYVVASRTGDGGFVARRSDSPLDAALTAPVAAPAATPGTASVRDLEVRRGDTLMRLVVREGANRTEADRAIRALGRYVDPAALQIGQRLQVVLSDGAAPELLGLSLQTGDNAFVTAERNAGGDFVARRTDAPVAAATPPAPIAPTIGALTASGADVERLTISRGDTMMDLMVQAGATITDAHEAARVLGRHFDPRRLQIGDSLYVVRVPGSAGSGLKVLGLVVLDAGDGDIVAVAREGDRFVGRRLDDLSEVALLAPEAATDEPGETETAPVADFGRDIRVERVEIAQGDTLMSVMTRAGAGRAEADRALSALRPHYDPRRLQIGQQVAVAFEDVDGGGEVLVAISVRLDDDLYVQADLQGSAFVAQRTSSPINPAFARTVEESAPAEDEIAGEAGGTAPEEAETEVALADPAEPVIELPMPVSELEREQGLSEAAEQVWFEIRSGDTVAGLLRELTNNGREIAAVTDMLGNAFDMGSLRPGQQLVVILDEDGAGTHIVAASLSTGEDGTLVVVRQHDGHYAIREAAGHVDLSDFVVDRAMSPRVPDLVDVWPTMAVGELPEIARTTIEIGPGGTLMNAMLDVGIDTVQADAAIDALRDVFNPRSIRAGQQVDLTHAGPDLVAIDFSPRAGERVEVALGDDGYVSRQVVLPTERSLHVARGTITTSLYVAAEEAGVPLPVLADLIRAYSFDVDFQREIRTGDGFEVLYETYTDENGEVVRYGLPLYAELNVSGVSLPIYRYTPGSGFTDYFNDKGESVRKALLRTPVDGARITSGFGMRDHPLLGYSRMHKGVDFGAPSGTPIMAAGDGVIEYMGGNGGYGNYVRIRHNSTYKTAYAHLRGFASGLSSGSRVRQGQVIGYVGTTGQSTGPHLHYEVMVNDEQINPLDVKLPAGEVLAGAELEQFYRERDALDAQYADQLARQYVAGEP